ncbi:MAG: hypothetical protein WDN28_32920 [Chthoniobacter sp.]
MTYRFSRSPVHLAAPIAQSCRSGPACPCCAAIARAQQQALFDALPEWCSPLTPGMQLVNLSHSEDGGKLRVDLGADWPRMFGQLSRAGEALVMTRNTAAIIGRRMQYPVLRVTSGGGKAASGEGGLWLDFRQLGAARAVHLRREERHVFGVEFADTTGNLVHRFTLTPESDMDEFFAWVRLHQACTADPSATSSTVAEASPAPSPARARRHCDTGALVSVVAACVDQKIAVRATVSGAGVTQRVEFTPGALQRSAGWWFASDDDTGLHFCPDLLARITLEEHTVLGAATEDGTTALLLEAGSPTMEGAWRRLLETMA